MVFRSFGDSLIGPAIPPGCLARLVKVLRLGESKGMQMFDWEGVRPAGSKRCFLWEMMQETGDWVSEGR